MGVRIVALTYLPSFGTRAPLLSGMGDGWRYRDRVAYLFRPLKIGYDASLPNLDFFRLGITKKLKKLHVFASVKEPDTAYSNSLPGTVHFISNSEYFKLLTFG